MQIGFAPRRDKTVSASALHYRSNSVATVAQSWPMRRSKRPLEPLMPSDLEWFALHYVERYATTRAKLGHYLRRKVRERGWAGDAEPDIDGLVQRLSDLRYVDDRFYAESKAGAMSRRGLGARRIRQALRMDGIAEGDSDAFDPVVEANVEASAVAYARKKRIGPFARDPVDRPKQEKQIAAMVRAGHSLEVARRFVCMSTDDDMYPLCDFETDG